MPTRTESHPDTPIGPDQSPMVAISPTLAHKLEGLAEEALRAMEAANASSEEPIYTSGSLSAALATLEELRAVVRGDVYLE